MLKTHTTVINLSSVSKNINNSPKVSSSQTIYLQTSKKLLVVRTLRVWDNADFRCCEILMQRNPRLVRCTVQSTIPRHAALAKMVGERLRASMEDDGHSVDIGRARPVL